MTPEQAIHIVAKQLIVNAAREIEWEDLPDIGEQDFMWLVEVMRELAPEPEGFDEAITVLVDRAAAWEKENSL